MLKTKKSFGLGAISMRKVLKLKNRPSIEEVKEQTYTDGKIEKINEMNKY